MKKNEIRKMNEQKLVRANNKYVHQLKTDIEGESRTNIPKSPPSNRKIVDNAPMLKPKSPEVKHKAEIDIHGSSKPLRSKQAVTKIPKLKSLSKKVEDKYDYKLG